MAIAFHPKHQKNSPKTKYPVSSANIKQNAAEQTG